MYKDLQIMKLSMIYLKYVSQLQEKSLYYIQLFLLGQGAFFCILFCLQKIGEKDQDFYDKRKQCLRFMLNLNIASLTLKFLKVVDMRCYLIRNVAVCRCDKKCCRQDSDYDYLWLITSGGQLQLYSCSSVYVPVCLSVVSSLNCSIVWFWIMYF